MTTLIKLWLEWDFGQDYYVFSDEETATAWVEKNVDLAELDNEFATHAEIFEAGLAGFKELELDPVQETATT